MRYRAVSYQTGKREELHKIDIEPVGSGRQRGFKFRGALTVDRLIGGDAIVGANNTPVSGGP